MTGYDAVNFAIIIEHHNGFRGFKFYGAALFTLRQHQFINALQMRQMRHQPGIILSQLCIWVLQNFMHLRVSHACF